MQGRSLLPPPAWDEFAERRARAMEMAKKRGLDGLLIWGRGGTNVDGSADLLYLSNHLSAVTHIHDTASGTARGHAALLLAEDREPLLITDAYDTAPDDIAVEDLRFSTFVDTDAGAAIVKAGLAGGRIGLAGAGGLLHTSYERIVAAAGHGTALVPADDILVELRLIKSPHEIDLLREASRVGSEWMMTLTDASLPGRTEGEIVGEGMRYVCAAQGWAYDTAVSSGPFASRYRHRQALPTWDSSRPVEEGDLIHFDIWGPMVHGYFCDLTRSTVVGRQPTPAQEKVLEDSIALVEHMIAGVEPGVLFKDVHRRAMTWLDSRGGAGSKFSEMIPFVGHSLGLDSELPLMTSDADQPILPNMVLAFEGFVADGPDLAAGYEQVIVVTESDLEIITTAPARPWLP